MTNPDSGDRLDRIETLLEQFIAASVADRQTSNERMTRIEELIADDRAASNERMTRIEAGIERIEQIVESNNRFLESFSANLQNYTESMNNLATRMSGVIGTNNQDRQETNSRLAAIQRQVAAIARHLGVI